MLQYEKPSSEIKAKRDSRWYHQICSSAIKELETEGITFVFDKEQVAEIVSGMNNIVTKDYKGIIILIKEDCV